MSDTDRTGYLRGCQSCSRFFVLDWSPRLEDFVAGEPPPWTCRECREGRR